MFLPLDINVSGFIIRGLFTIFQFESVVLCESTFDELSVALCCALLTDNCSCSCDTLAQSTKNKLDVIIRKWPITLLLPHL